MTDITGTVFYQGEHRHARLIDANISIAGDPHDSSAYVHLEIPGFRDDYMCYTSQFRTDPTDAVYRWLCEQWAPGQSPPDGNWEYFAWDLAEQDYQ